MLKNAALISMAAMHDAMSHSVGLTKKIFATLAVLVLLSSLAGCASRIQSNVSAFSAMGPEDAGKAIFIAPYDQENINSLEWQSYAQIMVGKLQEKGFNVVDDPKEADLVAFFGYAIDNGEQVTTAYSIPQWGITGYSGAYTTGTYNSYGSYGNYSSTTTLTPQYGVTGYTTGTTVSTVYTRSLSIDIIDAKNNDKKWEMQLASSGSCGRFTVVAPAFFEAAFQSFPTGSGGIVTLDWDGTC